MNKLFKEVGELRKMVEFQNHHPAYNADTVSIYSNVSGGLYHDNPSDVLQSDKVAQCVDNSQVSHSENLTTTDFTFGIETKLKEPSVPKTPDCYLKLLLDVQRLGSTSWSEVRYADTQKLYNHTPGFVDLETNDEVKIYDTLRHLAHSDKAYAAISFCVLKQNETLQANIRNLLSWSKNAEISFDSLSEKVEELFQKGEFHKVSSDLLQMVCGHRAEVIEMRRETISSQIRDPLVKSSINKIPPTSTCLFDPEKLTAVLEKAGGVRKAFWPPKSESQIKSNQTSSRPSRGYGARKQSVPSRGTSNMFHEQSGNHSQLTNYNNPPSRGAYHNSYYPQRRQPSYGPQDHHPYNNRGTFHNSGSRPDRSNNNNRGRYVSRGSRANSKKYKQ